MKYLFTIQGCPVYEDTEHRICYVARAMIDSDGAPNNPHKDKHWQAETSLTYQGQPINALTVPYIVVPPAIIHAVPGVVLGCEATVSYKGKSIAAVVADVGPRDKLGELSVRAAELLGIPSNANTGGISTPSVSYTLTPGRAAVVDGVRYTLKPSRAR